MVRTGVCRFERQNHRNGQATRHTVLKKKERQTLLHRRHVLAAQEDLSVRLIDYIHMCNIIRLASVKALIGEAKQMSKTIYVAKPFFW